MGPLERSAALPVGAQVVGCSCAVITDFGEDTEALAILKQHMSSN